MTQILLWTVSKNKQGTFLSCESKTNSVVVCITCKYLVSIWFVQNDINPLVTQTEVLIIWKERIPSVGGGNPSNCQLKSVSSLLKFCVPAPPAELRGNCVISLFEVTQITMPWNQASDDKVNQQVISPSKILKIPQMFLFVCFCHCLKCQWKVCSCLI